MPRAAAAEPDTEVFSALPPNAMPPSLGIGSASYTAYSGGSCNGADFDSSGATIIATGALQFVVTRDGRQVDITYTQLTNPLHSLGSASVFDTDLRQTRYRDKP